MLHVSGIYKDGCFKYNTEKYADFNLIHPVALTDNFKPFRRKYLLSGFPGSGNMLLQNLALKISRTSRRRQLKDRVFNRLEKTMMSAALSAYTDICDIVRQSFSNLHIKQLHFSPSHNIYGNISPAAQIEINSEIAIESSTLFGLPSRPHIWAKPFYMSHEIINNIQIDFLRKQGLECIYIVRDPLDTIISNASKMSLSASHNQKPQLLLSDRRWVYDIARTIKLYFENLDENRKVINIFYYEEILKNPIKSISDIANIFGIAVQSRDAEQIWASINGAQLSSPEHYWRPGEGKWREYFSTEMFSLVTTPDFAAAWRRFGYVYDAAALTAGQTAPEDRRPLDETVMLAWSDIDASTVYSKPISTASDAILFEQPDLGSGLCGVVANSRCAEAARAARTNQTLRTYLRALRPTDDGAAAPYAHRAAFGSDEPQ